MPGIQKEGSMDMCSMSSRLPVLAAMLTLFSCCCDHGRSDSIEVGVLEIQSTTSMPDTLFIAYPADACFGPSGEILVLDQAACVVHAFTPEGAYIETFGGCGDGPEEMGNPMSIESIDDQILVRDQPSQGYLVFDRTHAFLHEVNHWPRSSPTQIRHAGHGTFTAVRTGVVTLRDGFGCFREAGLYTVDGPEPVAVLFSDTIRVDPSNVATLERAMNAVHTASDASGRCYLTETSTDEYEIFRWDGGRCETFTVLQISPVRKSSSEIEREERLMTAQLLSMGAEGISGWEALPDRDAILGIGCRAGMLWVQTGQGVFPQFNVHSIETGEIVRMYEFPRPGEWNFRVDEHGILAWEEDPADGVFKVQVLRTRDTGLAAP